MESGREERRACVSARVLGDRRAEIPGLTKLAIGVTVKRTSSSSFFDANSVC